MEEILHHRECINIVNSRIDYQPQLVDSRRISAINSSSWIASFLAFVQLVFFK